MRLWNLAVALTISLFLFTSQAIANDWSPITDEIEVDYGLAQIRIFSIAKDHRGLETQARKLFLSYIKTLTVGAEKKPLAEELKVRPALNAKVQGLFETRVRSSSLPIQLPESNNLTTRYYTFELKYLKDLVPNLNFPQRDGAVQ